MKSTGYTSGLLSVLLTVGCTAAIAQTSTAPKGISHYMQETGLLYLETTKKLATAGLENPDAMQMIEPTQASEVNGYGSVLQEMEDHIQINISSVADKQFFRLLQRTKATAELAVYGDIPTYADCYATAHEIALRGTLGVRGCTEKQYEDAAKVVRDARLQAAKDSLEKTQQHLADVQKSAQEANAKTTAKFEADKKAKTEELCAKGVFDADYCATFRASQTPTQPR
jgi:hypothetical protein